MRKLLSTEICSVSGSGNLAAVAYGFFGGVVGAVFTAIACTLDPTIEERFNAYRKSFHKEKNELKNTQSTLPIEESLHI